MIDQAHADEPAMTSPGPDSMPDRGRTLMLLAAVGIAYALAGPLCIGPGLFGATIGWWVWRMADDDVAQMRAGRVDAAGLRRTQRAARLGKVGLALGVVTSIAGLFSPLNQLILVPFGAPVRILKLWYW